MNPKTPKNPDADSFPVRDPDIHVTWESPVFDLSGYAASARAALFSLEEAGVRIRLIPAKTQSGEVDGDPNQR
jgi:hypothetical protein